MPFLVQIKYPTDSRSPGSGTNNTSSRGGGRAGTDRYGGHGGANQFGSNDMCVGSSDLRIIKKGG